MSLNKVYDIGFKHALDNIEKNGGKINGDNVIIQTQTPLAVKFEQGFPGMYPVSKSRDYKNEGNEINFEFEGTGFALAR